MLRDSLIRDNAGGVALAGVGSQVFDNQFLFNSGTGLSVSGLRGHVFDNVAYGNSWGITASAGGAATRADWTVVEGNRVFDNANGIYGGSNVEVRENEAWGNGIGIQVENLAVALRNESWGNTTGVYLGGSSANGVGRENRVWGNSVGMSGYNALFEGNRVYGNTVGIRALTGTDGCSTTWCTTTRVWASMWITRTTWARTGW